jgi:hypothetical protein
MSDTRQGTTIPPKGPNAFSADKRLWTACDDGDLEGVKAAVIAKHEDRSPALLDRGDPDDKTVSVPSAPPVILT